MSYPKFKSREECAFPDRTICNYSEDGKIQRCPYMKYDNSKSIFDSTRWRCTYNKDAKDKQKEVSEQKVI